MPSSYLSSGDYAAFGVPGATADQVQKASAYIDGWLKRPEGLVWVPDGAGNPCYMAALAPTDTWTLPGSIAIAASQTLSGPTGRILSQDLIGEVLILDRATPAKTEAVAITAVDPAHGLVTIGQTAFSHSAGAIADFGLTINEERSMPAKRSMIRIGRSNACRLLSGVGRYGYGRRSDQQAGMYSEINLLATLQTFGGPPQWIAFDVRNASLSPATSELWVPAGILLAYYTDVRVWYLAGFPATGVPAIIKQAVAELVGLYMNMPAELASGVFKKVQAGDTSIERASAALLNEPQFSLLASYQSIAIG